MYHRPKNPEYQVGGTELKIDMKPAEKKEIEDRYENNTDKMPYRFNAGL